MNIIDTFISRLSETLLGQTHPGDFVGFVILAAAGIYIMSTLGTKLRDPGTLNSPNEFNWQYFWKDNRKRQIASGLLVLASIRFYPDIFNKPITPFLAFGLGFGWDGIMLIVKQRTTWLDPKSK